MPKYTELTQHSKWRESIGTSFGWSLPCTDSDCNDAEPSLYRSQRQHDQAKRVDACQSNQRLEEETPSSVVNKKGTLAPRNAAMMEWCHQGMMPTKKLQEPHDWNSTRSAILPGWKWECLQAGVQCSERTSQICLTHPILANWMYCAVKVLQHKQPKVAYNSGTRCDLEVPHFLVQSQMSFISWTDNSTHFAWLYRRVLAWP